MKKLFIMLMFLANASVVLARNFVLSVDGGILKRKDWTIEKNSKVK